MDVHYRTFAINGQQKRRSGRLKSYRIDDWNTLKAAFNYYCEATAKPGEGDERRWRCPRITQTRANGKRKLGATFACDLGRCWRAKVDQNRPQLPVKRLLTLFSGAVLRFLALFAFLFELAHALRQRRKLRESGVLFLEFFERTRGSAPHRLAAVDFFTGGDSCLRSGNRAVPLKSD